MAINLKDFETEIEYRLPIIILVDESGFDNEIEYSYFEFTEGSKTTHISFPSMAYAATMVEKLNEELIARNIRGSLAIISYGDKVSFRYPVLNENEGPRFVNIEDNDIVAMCNEIINIEQSRTAVLGTALKLTKAIIEDSDTLDFDCYEPMVIVLAAGQPSTGWEGAYKKLTEEGISGCSKIFYVDMNKEPNISKDITDSMVAYCPCQLDKSIVLDLNYSHVSPTAERWWAYFPDAFRGDDKQKDRIQKIIRNTLNENEFRKEFNTIEKQLGRQFYFREEIINNVRTKTEKKQNAASVEYGKNRLFMDLRADAEKFDGTDIISDIVSKFSFEPMQKTPKEVQVEIPKVAIPGSDTGHGDNPNAVGNGFI